MIIKNDFVDKMVNANFLFMDYNTTHMKKCQCTKCQCPNEIKEFGHRYEEENAIVQDEFNKDVDKAESIIENLCQSCSKGQHNGQPKS